MIHSLKGFRTMTKIAVVTDSTAYLPKELVEKYQIKTLPLQINWGDESFKDGIDLSPEDFYPRLSQSTVMPTTSQTPMFEFLNLFEKLAAHYQGIVVPLISSGISGTISSALAAKAEFDRIPVEIIDTKSSGAAQGMAALAAARAAQSGADFTEVVKAARESVENTQTFFVVDTLEFLHKGGRIGGASRYFGTTLQIKPILYFDDQGKIDALERVRTKKKALKRLVDLTVDKANSGKVMLGVMHSVAPEEANLVRQELESLLDCEEVITLELSPVIGTHVGPGTIGVAINRV
jgi:DegV family protein with EDD domain